MSSRHEKIFNQFQDQHPILDYYTSSRSRQTSSSFEKNDLSFVEVLTAATAAASNISMTDLPSDMDDYDLNYYDNNSNKIDTKKMTEKKNRVYKDEKEMFEAKHSILPNIYALNKDLHQIKKKTPPKQTNKKQIGLYKNEHSDSNGVSINYNNCWLSMLEAKAITKAIHTGNLTNIHSISLENSHIGDKGLASILKELCEVNLKELNFCNCKMGSSACKELQAILEIHDVKLERLNIASNSLTKKSISGILYSLEIGRPKYLNYFNMSSNKIASISNLKSKKISFHGLLSCCQGIKEVNVSWNSLDKYFLEVCDLVISNFTLQYLDLSSSCNNKNGEYDFALHELICDSNLTHLNISRNHINGKTVSVLLHALEKNTKLGNLKLNDNPIGISAAKSIVSFLLSSQLGRILSKCKIDVSSCTFVDDQIDDLLSITSSFYQQFYDLSLNKKYDKLLADRLLRMDAMVENRTYFNEHGKKVAQFDWLNELPDCGLIKIKVKKVANLNSSHKKEVNGCSFQCIVEFLKSISEVHARKELILAFIYGRLFSFKQGKELIALFDEVMDHNTRVEIGIQLIPRTIKTSMEASVIYALQNSGAKKVSFFRHYQPSKQTRLMLESFGLKRLSKAVVKIYEKNMEKWLSYSLNNPNGHYCLDLNEPTDQTILTQLKELNANFIFFCHQHRYQDVSQHGDWQIFRNISSESTSSTVFEADVSIIPAFLQQNSTHSPMNDSMFNQFLNEYFDLDISSAEMLKMLRMVSVPYYFSCEQVAKLMEVFPYSELGKNSQNKCRVQVLVILYAKIIDIFNIYKPLHQLDARDRIKAMTILGPLQIFNPIFADGIYSLNLSVPDERILGEQLIKMSVASGPYPAELRGFFSEEPLEKIEVPLCDFINLPLLSKKKLKKKSPNHAKKYLHAYFSFVSLDLSMKNPLREEELLEKSKLMCQHYQWDYAKFLNASS